MPKSPAKTAKNSAEWRAMTPAERRQERYTSLPQSPPRDIGLVEAFLPDTSSKRPVGRPKAKPSAYDEQAVKTLFEIMGTGVGLRRACDDPRCPEYTDVYRRACGVDPDFTTRLHDAREKQQGALVDKTYEIAVAATVENWQVARLQIQTIQWGAARLAPKVYGEKSQLNLIVNDALSDRLTAALKRQRELAASGTVQIEGVAEPDVAALPAPGESTEKG